MKHTASKRFWKCYDALSSEMQALSKKNFELLKHDSGHPSLQFKLLGGGKLYSARVGLYYGAPGSAFAQPVHAQHALLLDRLDADEAHGGPNP